MSGCGLPIAALLDLALSATEEVVHTCMGVEQFGIGERGRGEPTYECGTMLPLVAHATTMYVCLFSSESGCKSLAAALLGLDDCDDALTGEVVRDGVGEIVNVLAGIMQRQLGETFPGIELALPCFISGKVKYHEFDSAELADIRIGETGAQLMVFGNSRAGG